MREDLKKLKHLGVSAKNNKDRYQFENPDPSLLETFDNKFPGNECVVTFHSRDNLSSLCPITGQPDLCLNLWIQYVPDKELVESKSLKLYLNGFRMFGSFHEEICHIIANDLWVTLEPLWIKVTADYASRGGLSIIPSVVKARPTLDSQIVKRYYPASDIILPVGLTREYH